MNTIRKLTNWFYQSLTSIGNLTKKKVSDIVSVVKPQLSYILESVKPQRKIKNTVEQSIEQQEINVSELKNYHEHAPAKQFKNIAATYLIKHDMLNNHDEIHLFLSDYQKQVNSRLNHLLEERLREHSGIKYIIVLKAQFKSTIAGNIASFHFWSSDVKNATIIASRMEIQESIDENFEHLQNRIDEFINKGSGWRVESIDQLEVNIVKYAPLKGSSYISIPVSIAKRQACINVRNEDNRCFAYAVTSAIYPVDSKNHPQRPSHYEKHFSNLNMEGIEYPVALDKIKKFEKQNLKYGINVFLLEEKDEIVPRVICKDKDRKIINLLLISDEEKQHYVWIKNFSRLMSTKVSKNGHELYWCYNCLSHFTTEALLNNHKQNGCYDNPCAKVYLPEPNTDDAFIEYTVAMMKKQLKVPFVIYADFEALLKEMISNSKYQEHIACSYGYKVVSAYEQYKQKYHGYRGENAIRKFLESLVEEQKLIINILNTNTPMRITAAEKKEFKNATYCHICEKKLNNDRVKDHDHITGKYRGAAHSNCNINYNYKNVKIPVVFHNLRGYDSHLIMQEIGKYSKNITIIPNTTEKYVSFTMDRLVFIDSLQFLSASLEKLVECLLGEKVEDKKKNINLASNLLEGFKDCTDEQLMLLLRKGVYSYDYMNCWERFDEPSLPPISEFYSKLNDEDAEPEDYNHATQVFKLFKCKHLGDFHDLYLKTDVLLLADVFENFRNVSLQTYKLDPAHFYTAPGLSWYAMLKTVGKKIELFNSTQIDMLNVFEQNKRGGVCMISKRYAKANNKYMKSYDPSKPSSYIIYLDANNLYGYGMSQYMPIGNFIDEDPSSFDQDKILSWPDDAERGFYCIFDADYPKELHDQHNDYPLAPENIKGEYSPLMKGIMSQHKIKENNTEKLIPNLYNKTKYGSHYRLLKFYLSHGLELKKIHRVISFDQEPWLKPYIDLNSQKRANAKNDFEKDFFKLLNNSIYGKACENIRNRKDIKLCVTAEKAQKLFNKPKFKNCTIFKENELIAVEMAKTKIKFDKPVYLGACILDLSKLLMYEFHYDFIKSLYGDKAKLLFTDTDSLCYEIQAEDIYKDMLKHKDKFDFSDYPEEHECYDKTNKKVIGKFKDEANGKIITEFIGLRPKLYSYIIEGDDKDHRRAKGIKKQVIKNKITHEHYRKALFGTTKDELVHNVKFNIIKSKNHIINSVMVNKIGLSCMDNKRWVWDNNDDTYAIGHYKTKTANN